MYNIYIYNTYNMYIYIYNIICIHMYIYIYKATSVGGVGDGCDRGGEATSVEA